MTIAKPFHRYEYTPYSKAELIKSIPSYLKGKTATRRCCYYYPPSPPPPKRRCYYYPPVSPPPPQKRRCYYYPPSPPPPPPPPLSPLSSPLPLPLRNSRSNNNKINDENNKRRTPIIQNKNKKQVRFAPKLQQQVKFVPTKTLEDIKQSWYSDEEYKNFHLERRRTVAAVNEAQAHDGDLSRLLADENMTIAGLENNLRFEQVVARKSLTRRRWYYVLRAQHEQNGDEDQLRQISLLFSQQPARRAHFRGILDFGLNYNNYNMNNNYNQTTATTPRQEETLANSNTQVRGHYYY